LSRNPGTCFGLSFAFLVASALALTEQAGAKHASAPPRRGPVLWRADMEDRTLADWYFPKGGDGRNYGGGEYNSDGGASAASSAAANRSGAWSARQTIAPSAMGPSGTRLFRWYEPDRHSALYYSAWFLFPRAMALQPGGWFNLMQWKSIRGRDNDPMWAILVGNRPGGGMYLYLARQPDIPGPTYRRSIATVPVGRWFRVDAFYRASSGPRGRVTVWQNGRRLYNIDGVATSYHAINSAGNPWSVQWSVNAFGCCLSPTPWTHYVDNATIALPRQS
jgi:Polysaccharide lyase